MRRALKRERVRMWFQFGGLKAWLLGLPRGVKRSILLAGDTCACLVAVPLALFLRLGYFPSIGPEVLAVSGLAVVTAMPVFFALGLYREIFRYSGWGAMTTIARAVGIAAVPMFVIVTLIGVPNVPRTVGIIEPIILLVVLRISRTLARNWLTKPLGRFGEAAASVRVVIYGAGASGRQLRSALSIGSEREVVAYIDDDDAKQGHRIDGLHVYAPDNLSSLARRLSIAEVLLAIPSASRARRNEIIASMRESAVRVQTLPGMSDLASGRVKVGDLRELGIEDLLGRDAVVPNATLLARNVSGKTILVTGAGGSIGSEICRQVLASGPGVLLLFDISEFALYSIHQELAATLSTQETVLIPLLGSVTDDRRLNEIVGAWRPQTIYHAAAYKHVPLVEHNVVEGIRNNALGTLRTAQVAAAHGVSDFVLISTDKAVRPTNVMGASKRLAELVLQAMAARDTGTRFSMVRFGNVLGSSGSVVPLFRRQIAAGGPVTVTHADMTRYFMTIPEAAQLVIQAGAMAEGGEVFVLDMGSPVAIVELARNMINLSGLRERSERNPYGDVEITFVGLRPGEKLYEELLIGDNPEPTSHPRILKANEKMLPWSILARKLEELRGVLDRGDVVAARGILLDLVTEFEPDANVVDYIYKLRAG